MSREEEIRSELRRMPTSERVPQPVGDDLEKGEVHDLDCQEEVGSEDSEKAVELRAAADQTPQEQTRIGPPQET